MAHIRIEKRTEGVVIDINGKREELVALLSLALAHPENEGFRIIMQESIEFLIQEQENEKKSNLN